MMTQKPDEFSVAVVSAMELFIDAIPDAGTLKRSELVISRELITTSFGLDLESTLRSYSHVAPILR
jgi:hypothetical protein